MNTPPHPYNTRSSPQPPPSVSTTVQSERLYTMKAEILGFCPGTNDLAQRYLQDHRDRSFTLVVFEWGKHINTATDFEEFSNQCILPPNRDRAGAAAQIQIQETIALLKEKWSATYTAYESTWQIWATTILKKPFHQHAISIQLPPPSFLLHLMTLRGNGAEDPSANAIQSLSLARDVIKALRDDLTCLSQRDPLMMPLLASTEV
ncbi:hypothetical protein AC1031_016527 [Aphanomyces cochlioides]|nr:hypothetical protein AC1031_016527 [Aphanomyces cochlioides]